jgi:hypothetical protein
LLNKAEAVTPKLCPGVQHHQVIWIKKPAYVVNPNGDVLLGMTQLAQGSPATAYNQGFSAMEVTEAGEGKGHFFDRGDRLLRRPSAADTDSSGVHGCSDCRKLTPERRVRRHVVRYG